MDINRLEDVSRYLGNPEQMYGVERFVCDEGTNKGSTVYEVRTGGGLAFKVMADTAMDIGELYYKGINMHYLTKNGHQSPDRFHPFASDFFYSFPGGMLYTCGLLSAGDGNEDGGFWHPIHGRVHAVPARQCASEIADGKITLKGQIRDTRYSGHCLQLDRTLSAPVGQACVELCDKLTNCTPEDEEYMIIYHMNFGYPFLSPALQAELPEGSNVFRPSGWAKENAGKEFSFTEPQDGCPDGVFFHKIPESKMRLQNPELGIGVEISWSGDTLPNLAQWKCMRSGEYVLGIEPTNSFVMGRSAERKNGTIGKIKAFETVEMKVRLQFFEI